MISINDSTLGSKDTLTEKPFQKEVMVIVIKLTLTGKFPGKGETRARGVREASGKRPGRPAARAFPQAGPAWPCAPPLLRRRRSVPHPVISIVKFTKPFLGEICSLVPGMGSAPDSVE